MPADPPVPPPGQHLDPAKRRLIALVIAAVAFLSGLYIYYAATQGGTPQWRAALAGSSALFLFGPVALGMLHSPQRAQQVMMVQGVIVGVLAFMLSRCTPV